MKQRKTNNASSTDSDEALTALNALKEIVGKNADLANEAQPLLEQLELQINEKNSELKEKDQEIKEGEELIGELRDHIATLEKAVQKGGGVPEVTIKGARFLVTSGAKIAGKKFTQDELLNNKKALAALLEIPGQQVLVPVEEEGSEEEEGKEGN